jgi:DNA-binding XRE family transcriptional regulator
MTNAEARIRALVNEAKRTEQWLYVEQADLRELLSELDRLRQPDLLAVMAYDAGRESERVRAGRPTDAVKLIETRLGYKPSLGYDFTMAREQVAHQVAGLRERHGLTQEQLANKIGCTVETIQRLEQSTADVTFEMLVRIAYACGERLQAEFQPVGEGPGE